MGVCVCVCDCVCVDNERKFYQVLKHKHILSNVLFQNEFQTVHVTIQEDAHGLISKRVITVCSRKCVVWLEIIKSWENFFKFKYRNKVTIVETLRFGVWYIGFGKTCFPKLTIFGLLLSRIM